ncbi:MULTISPECIES: MBL fold metallo-hydrolase [unclassified Kaistella]|uniref:MBL fold metallo-hydrolase n=1 Tax=unclassified Kaistella TaxID=2762626 RepID=UPI002735302D|nr:MULTISPECIES: MBL fold metallo-hydrolase [unclassified Kaistella]MCZ2084202.1 MBL fold metallo-hydrolase [Flavobacteriales bacterium]MDP2454079.1 MBL fold metallo-hydrolase [Kaistella sp. SH11-4b]MDP2457136.1 MBL fold metallo-hydrolase [Kaistella sp. SH40-3]MDP2459894.1 MBL fold metallo-hydrolase [Kaistella sp. SH19-2b]
MKLKFLGSGTSQGVPVIACHCEVCTSLNPKDRRFRSSALVTTDSGKKILIDCGPDFRMQMLENREEQIDAVLLTHEHNDHVIGLDDMRPLIFRNKKNIEIYCMKRVGDEIKSRFPYAFADVKYPGAPSFDLHEIQNRSFEILGTDISPIEVLHHRLPIFGYKIKDLAYITDASFITNEEKEKLKNLDFLIVNCIRKEDIHPAHFILPQVIDLFEELKPKKMYLTHISHHMGLHDDTEMELPDNMFLAYDGLEIDF